MQVISSKQIKKSATRRQQKLLYANVIIAWLIFVTATIGFVILSDVKQTRQLFHNDTSRLEHHISERIQSFEIVLEGFAALLSVTDDHDYSRIRAYTKQILSSNSGIKAFEIIESVPIKKTATFIKNARKKIDPEFTLTHFNIDTSELEYISPRKYYHPVIFTEPYPVDLNNSIGLNLNSRVDFRDTLMRSMASKTSRATKVYSLKNGEMAYLLIKAIDNTLKPNSPVRFSALIILTDSLAPNNLSLIKGMKTEIQQFNSIGNKQNLFSHETIEKQQSELEKLLLPKFSVNRTINSATQPFILTRQLQMGWGHLNWQLLLIVVFLSVISFIIAIAFAKQYHNDRMQKLETADRLFHLANHDALTGLPNRNLLDDRLHHAIEQAKRKSYRIAVLFLDLNGFKKINDTYGHHVGDMLLIEAANRLSDCMRDGDTVARRGGDEFVIILENFSSQNELNGVVSKIVSAFDSGFHIDAKNLSVGVSIGFAVYPNDGDDMHSILTIADQAMYDEKARIYQDEDRKLAG